MRTDAPGDVASLPGAQLIGYLDTGRDGERATGTAQDEDVPVFFFHDLGGSRLTIPPDAAALAAQAHARVIAVDRPGIGYSAIQPSRTLLDWPDTVAALADMLRIERFAVLGHAWGGPYALACAYKLPERVAAVGVVCGVPPFAGPDAMTRISGPLVQTVRAAQRVPWLLRPHLSSLSRQALNNPEQLYRDALRDASPPDQAILREPAMHAHILATAAEPYREGIAGMYIDSVLGARDWGFRPRDVALPVHLWHGEQDRTVPPEMGRHLAARLPQAHTHFLPDDGHLLHYARWGELLATLASNVAPR